MTWGDPRLKYIRVPVFKQVMNYIQGDPVSGFPCGYDPCPTLSEASLCFLFQGRDEKTGRKKNSSELQSLHPVGNEMNSGN